MYSININKIFFNQKTNLTLFIYDGNVISNIKISVKCVKLCPNLTFHKEENRAHPHDTTPKNKNTIYTNIQKLRFTIPLHEL